MEGLVNFCPLLDYVAENAEAGAFHLVDVGCSGGIDRQWRRLRGGVRAIGIDPDIEEIARLKNKERHPGFSYLNAFAAIGADHPFAIEREGKPELERNPWTRLSTARYMELAYSHQKEVSEKEKRSANLWAGAQLADSAVIVPEYLASCGVTSVDFLKIDVDGKDYEILQSFDQALRGLGVLGVGIEVRFWGSDAHSDGTFHNVDRFLKAQGFELFNLTVRRYSARALPSRFWGRAPGATGMGRVHQGDAMYARDFGSGLYEEFAKSLSAEKILNLAVVFAIFDLPDCAAEVLLKYRALLTGKWDVDRMLDLLSMQAERNLSYSAGRYRRHVERFERRPRTFLGTRNPVARMGWSWRNGYLKWRGRMQLLKMEREGN